MTLPEFSALYKQLAEARKADDSRFRFLATVVEQGAGGSRNFMEDADQPPESCGADAFAAWLKARATDAP